MLFIVLSVLISLVILVAFYKFKIKFTYPLAFVILLVGAAAVVYGLFNSSWANDVAQVFFYPVITVIFIMFENSYNIFNKIQTTLFRKQE
ncbi:MAG: hypothetical protein A4E32_01253 [Methanomassiliicoccales archaeon PtaU1.Bin124]|nr:MAG: hypothetical protein A4E32_01253 [Methanomassiliicoccales archaeon PtaU1.Bin124]